MKEYLFKIAIILKDTNKAISYQGVPGAPFNKVSYKFFETGMIVHLKCLTKFNQ